MKRDAEKVAKVLDGVGWADIELPEELKSLKEGAFKELSARLQTLTDEQKQLETQAGNLIKKEAERLQMVWG
ncbi:MAG TPA: hypothetical protein PKU69_02440, partial [Bacillota bacterium]|nr:hypothetical protein [Bacillota bacterium]